MLIDTFLESANDDGQKDSKVGDHSLIHMHVLIICSFIFVLLIINFLKCFIYFFLLLPNICPVVFKLLFLFLMVIILFYFMTAMLNVSIRTGCDRGSK